MLLRWFWLLLQRFAATPIDPAMVLIGSGGLCNAADWFCSGFECFWLFSVGFRGRGGSVEVQADLGTYFSAQESIYHAQEWNFHAGDSIFRAGGGQGEAQGT